MHVTVDSSFLENSSCDSHKSYDRVDNLIVSYGSTDYHKLDI